MEAKLYYTAPSDEAFEDMRQAALKVWKQYEDEPDYFAQKTGRLKEIGNIKDNFMYIFAMFDHPNQIKCIRLLNEDTKLALKERMIDGGNEPWLIQSLGL